MNNNSCAVNYCTVNVYRRSLLRVSVHNVMLAEAADNDFWAHRQKSSITLLTANMRRYNFQSELASSGKYLVDTLQRYTSEFNVHTASVAQIGS